MIFTHLIIYSFTHIDCSIIAGTLFANNLRKQAFYRRRPQSHQYFQYEETYCNSINFHFTPNSKRSKRVSSKSGNQRFQPSKRLQYYEWRGYGGQSFRLQ